MIELTERAQKEFEIFMDHCRQKLAETIQRETDSILSTCYTDYGMHLGSDVWVNYREHLRDEMAGGLYREVTEDVESQWAKNVRHMIFKEHKEALVEALNQDAIRKIKSLQDELTKAYQTRMF